MSKPVAATTIDDVVRMAIEDLFPNQTIPDENNYLSSGDQFKAPDHSIMDGAVLVERKSGNATDRSKYYKKLQEIAKSQGVPFFAVGRFNMGAVIRSFPDPASATAKMTDYMLSQTWKRIADTRRKFDDYRRHIETVGSSFALVFSDNSDLRLSTAPHEYFLARKMGGVGDEIDQTTGIDAIIFVKDPRLVLDEPGSYWFKCLMKRRLGVEPQRHLATFAAMLHDRVADYSDYYEASKTSKCGEFRILMV